MPAKLKALLLEQWLPRLREHPHRRRLARAGRLFGICLMVISLVFLSTILAYSWTEIRPYLAQANLWYLLAAQIATTGALLFGGVMWFFVQKALGVPTSWSESFWVHLLSNITKYAPGFAWQYASKGYLTKQRGATVRQSTLLILTEFLLLILGGILLGALAALFSGDRIRLFGEAQLARAMWLGVGGGATGGIVVWYRILLRYLPDSAQRLQITYYVTALVSGVVGWCLFALSVWFLIRSLVVVGPADVIYCLFALVFAGVASILVVFVPGGFGIREASLAVLLGNLLPFALGATVGILLRGSVIIGELLGAGAVLLLFRPRAKQTYEVPDDSG